MVETEEGWHILPDGEKLYTKTWKSDGPPKAVLAFVHGFSDHCNFYYDFFPTLCSYGIEVRAFDQRGWGRSVMTSATRGLTGSTNVVLSDIHSFLTSIRASLQTPVADSDSGIGQADPPPIFLMGHSMGGGEVLYYMLNSPLFPPWIRGVMAFSPLVALHPSTKPWNLTVKTGRLAAKVVPHRQLHKALDPSILCRDKRVCEDYKQDPLCHDTGTLEGLAGMLDRAEWLDSLRLTPDAALPRETPLWVCHGTADEVNSFAATKLFVEAVAVHNKTFKEYEGGFHKLNMEPNGIKEAFVKDVAEWILGPCHDSQQDNDERGISKPKL